MLSSILSGLRRCINLIHTFSKIYLTYTKPVLITEVQYSQKKKQDSQKNCIKTHNLEVTKLVKEKKLKASMKIHENQINSRQKPSLHFYWAECLKEFSLLWLLLSISFKFNCCLFFPQSWMNFFRHKVCSLIKIKK